MDTIGLIIDPDHMHKEIQASHKRSELHGISRHERSWQQIRLTPAQLIERRHSYNDFVEVATSHADIARFAVHNKLIKE